MKIIRTEPLRKFETGLTGVSITDCARIELAPDEQVTFTTPSGGEYDVVRKAWGFYATPSLNRRLPSFRLHPALVRNGDGRYFIKLVEEGCHDLFNGYLVEERCEVICWLDDLGALERIAAVFGRR